MPKHESTGCAHLLRFVGVCSSAGTNSTTYFLPEVDTYIRLASNVRLEIQVKGAIEDGDFYRATLGPSLEFNFKPLKNLKTSLSSIWTT